MSWDACRWLPTTHHLTGLRICAACNPLRIPGPGCGLQASRVGVRQPAEYTTSHCKDCQGQEVLPEREPTQSTLDDPSLGTGRCCRSTCGRLSLHGRKMTSLRKKTKTALDAPMPSLTLRSLLRSSIRSCSDGRPKIAQLQLIAQRI